MTDQDTTSGWVLEPELNRRLRLEMIEKCREQGRDKEVILEAEELLELEPTCVEALFFLGEALLQIGDAEGALQAFEQHREHVGALSVAVQIGLAMAHFELCDLAAAELAARGALSRASGEAQAHYVLGLILEISSNGMRESTAAFHAANQLDPERYPFPMVLKKEEWKECVELALTEIPSAIRNFWDGLPVHLFESPDINELSNHSPPLSPRVLGLYIGDPSGDQKDRRPEGLRLFTRNLSRSRTQGEIVLKIASTLEQEALDWMGKGPTGKDK